MTVDHNRQVIVLVDDETEITEALAFALERPGRTIVICSDLESAEMAVGHYPVTHLVTDVQFSGQFGFEGLHFISRARMKAPQCRIILMTGLVTDVLRGTAMALGATAVLAKPFEIEQLEQALGALPAQIGDTVPGGIVRVPSIEAILHGGLLKTAFQPIVTLDDRGDFRPFGFEALTRIDWIGDGPSLMFEYASRRSSLAELNIATIRQAFRAAKHIPEAAALFINVDPPTFDHRRLTSTIVAASECSRVPLSRVVLEITERSGFSEQIRDSTIFDELRETGIRFALDDHGSAYSHLAVINRIRPSFIKVSQGFGTDFEKDDTKTRIVSHVFALSRDFGCQTILEGVESPETVSAAAEIGIGLAQGFHFGRPVLAGGGASLSPCAA